MACMANITSQKAGFLGPQYQHMLGHCPLNPTGGLRSPQTPGAIGYPPIIYKLPASTKENKNPAFDCEEALYIVTSWILFTIMIARRAKTMPTFCAQKLICVHLHCYHEYTILLLPCGLPKELLWMIEVHSLWPNLSKLIPSVIFRDFCSDRELIISQGWSK